LEFGFGLDAGSLGFQLRLLDRSLALDAVSLGPGLRLSLCLPGGLYRSRQGLQLDQLGALRLCVCLIPDLLAFELTASLLLDVGRLVLCRSLLRVGCDLNRQLDRLLESISGALIDRLGGLDVDRRDLQAVLWERKDVPHLSICGDAKDGRADNLRRVLVKVVKLHPRDGAANP
jgi:hypothetical protein